MSPRRPMLRPPRVLFVALGASVHTARWLRQLEGLGWDLHLVPSDGMEGHADLREVTIHALLRKPPHGERAAHVGLRSPLALGHHPSVSQRGLWFPVPGLGGRLERSLGRQVAYRPRLLARVISRVRPDLVHTLELNQSGALTLAARGLVRGPFPHWVVTNWGSDLSLLGRLPEEALALRALLAACQEYACECERDVRLAREFGFQGPVWPVVPNSGGFDLAAATRLRSGPPSRRRVIALKGYQNWAGRALVALRALATCGVDLRGWTLALHSASPDVVLAARLLALDAGLRLEVLPPSGHEAVLALHGRARVSIGLSIGDGISTSALEAMVMGSFPVQSDSSAAGEWFSDGSGGLLVPAEDPQAVAAALRRALTDDALVDAAAARNAAVSAARLDARVIRATVQAAYERALERASGRGRPA